MWEMKQPQLGLGLGTFWTLDREAAFFFAAEESYSWE